MPNFTPLLCCIGNAVVKHGSRALLRLVPFGQVAYDVAVDAYQEYRKDHPEADLRSEVESLAQASPEEVKQAAEAVVLQEAKEQSEYVRQALNFYLQQVPTSIRQSLRRPSDPGGTTVPPEHLLQQPQHLLPFLPTRLPRFRPGDTPLAADWQLEELLGVGGFGEVWKAHHLTLPHHPPVALKFCLNPTAAQSLRNEVDMHRLLAQVREQGTHPGIVTLRQTYLRSDPPCLEYEYIGSGDLAGLIQEMHSRNRLTPLFAAQIVLKLAKTVAHAHRLNPPLVHRDLKPSNILVQRAEGEHVCLFIADFGIGGLAAGQMIRDQRNRSLSIQMLPTAVRGAYTPLYASPQQVAGGKPDPRDDVHALGVIWYQLVSGELHLTSIPPEWREVMEECGLDQDMLQLLASCITSRSTKRLPNAGELENRLGALFKSKPEEKNVETSVFTTTNTLSSLPRQMLMDGQSPPQNQAVADTPASASLPVPTPPVSAEQARPQEDRPARTLLSTPPPQDPPEEPTQEFTKSIGMQFARIPKGTFWMSKNGQNVQRQVEIGYDFYLGLYQVTQEQWKTVMGTNPSWFSRTGGGTDKVKAISDADLRQFPVENVSWDDIQEYIKKLNGRERNSSWMYGLPTEAEWEYACRGGTRSKKECSYDFYLWDEKSNREILTNDLSSTQANFDGNNPAGQALKGPYLQRTAKVGSYLPNRLGLYDMHGNVWEWTDTQEDSDPVCRGGSWDYHGRHCRAAAFSRDRPALRDFFLGFRLAHVHVWSRPEYAAPGVEADGH